MYPQNSFNDGGALKELRDSWLEAIKAGLQEKARTYARGAKECLDFYLGDHSYLFKPGFIQNQMYLSAPGADEKPGRLPHFRISDNIAAKFVQIMRPYLTQGVLRRSVLPNKPYMPPPAAYGITPGFIEQLQTVPPDVLPDLLKKNPQIAQQYQAVMKMEQDKQYVITDSSLRQARADMMEKVLNYSATELNISGERKRIVEEALVIGAGVYLTEITAMPGTQGEKLIGSRYIQMNDLVWDPDATQSKDCKWMALQCRAPAWLVARQYNVPEETIKPTSASTVSTQYYKELLVRAGADNVTAKKPAEDEVVYWKVWSRMGAGARLNPWTKRSETSKQLDQSLGDFCFFVVTDCVEYPLNLNDMVFQEAMKANEMAPRALAMGVSPDQVITGKQVMSMAVQWPTPYYLDVDDPWPVTLQEFHKRSGSPYPIPHLEFCLSYMKFLVWILSFVADKCYRSNRDFWLLDDSIAAQVIEAIESGDDEAIVKMKDLAGTTIDQFIKILEAPEVKKSILEVYQFFEAKFAQMSGLTELLQAELARSMRTATEAQVVSDVSQLRPRSMAEEVAATDSRVARKEAIAWQMHGRPEDIAPILSQPGAEAWMNLNSGVPPVRMLRETQFDVISGPGRQLDLNTRQDQSNKMAQLILPLLVQYGQLTGRFGPANQVLIEYAKANQIDTDLVQLPDTPPPPPAPAKGVASTSSKQESKGP